MARLVRFGAHSFRYFASMPFFINFLSWGHREQDAPDKKNKMNNKEREIRQESDLSAKYGKARQDVVMPVS